MNISSWILKKWGWEIIGDFSDYKKSMVIVAPHTSNFDFPIGILLRNHFGIMINFIAKEALFKAPHGFIFRKLGGYPVVRNKNSNQVEQVVKLYEEQDELRLSIAPEGTRSKVKKWKTGFYWIAKGAKIPIIMVAFDWGNMKVIIEKPFFPTEDKDKDFEFMQNYFKGIKGYVDR